MEFYSNHLGMMFNALYDALCMEYTIDGITFSLFDVCKAGLVFYIIGFALKQFWNPIDKIGD